MDIRLFSRSAAMSALVAVAAGSAPAAAQDEAPRAVVRYGDLDLASDAGAAALRSRVRRAAANLYAVEPSTDLARRMVVERARGEAIARAAVQADAAIRSVRETAARAAPKAS